MQGISQEQLGKPGAKTDEWRNSSKGPEQDVTGLQSTPFSKGFATLEQKRGH